MVERIPITFTVDHIVIETIARSLWIAEGKPDGKDKEHWDKAIELYKVTVIRDFERVYNTCSLQV